MWCSPAFAVQVTAWIEHWYATKQNPLDELSPKMQAQVASIVAGVLSQLQPTQQPAQPASPPEALMAAETAKALDRIWGFSRKWGCEPSSKYKAWTAETLTAQALGQKPRMLAESNMHQASEFWKAKHREGWRSTTKKDMAVTLGVYAAQYCKSRRLSRESAPQIHRSGRPISVGLWPLEALEHAWKRCVQEGRVRQLLVLGA
jgi:hypothetical protein